MNDLNTKQLRALWVGIILAALIVLFAPRNGYGYGPHFIFASSYYGKVDIPRTMLLLGLVGGVTYAAIYSLRSKSR